MDTVARNQKIISFLNKYKYVALILLLGIVLMAIPNQQKEEVTSVPDTAPENEKSVSLNDELARILSQIKGAGKVSVMLTIAAGEETIYQTDEDVTMSEESTVSRYDTIIVTDAQRAQAGLVRQINPVIYQGAIVVCEGAANPTVRLAIVEAVSKATGLGADRISVLKMK